MDWERSAVNGGSDALRSSSLAGALLSLTFCGDYVCCGAADHTIRLWDREYCVDIKGPSAHSQHGASGSSAVARTEL